MTSPTATLNSGYSIPLVGLGTWQSKPEQVTHAVSSALQTGYRHVDCAWAYGNEKDVGKGIKESGVKREDVFITSKLWGTWHSRVEQALDATLANLGVDYLDLYLVHWPIALNPNGSHPFIPLLPDGTRDVVRDWKLEDTWAQMETMVQKGKTRSIGVSNCSEMNLDKILASCSIMPAVNQLEIHPYNPQHVLQGYCKDKGILVQAYSPLGSTGSPLLKDEVVVALAQRLGVSEADVLLGWGVKKGIVVLPKSVTPKRIEANLNGAVNTAGLLTDQDIKTLDGLAAQGKQKRFVTPPWPVELGFENWP